ncbi:MAG: PaaI family thioesterase [Anaerolineales bacterium]|nr:PaaI family thioesterase [Anaerolineales bacterium]
MDGAKIPRDEQAWMDSFDQVSANTAVAHLGIELELISDEQIVMTMPITDKTRQPLGLLHGGITMALVETAASFHATWGADLSQVIPVGIEISGSHIRSATQGTVRAVGRVVRRSKSMIVHQVDVYLIESGKLLTTARMTNYYKPVSGDRQP